MPINQGFLDILRCPASQEALEVCSEAQLVSLNEKILAGNVINKKGVLVKTELQEALFCPKSKLVYAINHQIPVLLVEEAIELA